MSTFLVSLGVIVMVVAWVTWLALRDPEQRATEQRPSRRAQRRRDSGRRRPVNPVAPLPPAAPITPARPAVSSGTRVSPFPHHTLRTGAGAPPVAAPGRLAKRGEPVPVSRYLVTDAPVSRARAGLALTVLVTFVGITVALTIAGGIFFVAEGLRTTAR